MHLESTGLGNSLYLYNANPPRAPHVLAHLTLTAAPIVLTTNQASRVDSENARCSRGPQEGQNGYEAADLRGHPSRLDPVPGIAVPNSRVNPETLWDPPWTSLVSSPWG